MNTLGKFLREQKQIEMYGQYQDMVQEMIDIRKDNKELKKELRDWKNRYFIARELERLQKENEELIEKGVKKLHKISELRKENDKLKEDVRVAEAQIQSQKMQLKSCRTWNSKEIKSLMDSLSRVKKENEELKKEMPTPFFLPQSNLDNK